MTRRLRARAAEVIGSMAGGTAAGHAWAPNWRVWSSLLAGTHHAYLFANRRANRMKVLVHDGIGVWLAARRLNIGKFTWSSDAASTLLLSRAQFDALVLGLPWQRVGEAGIIRVI